MRTSESADPGTTDPDTTDPDTTLPGTPTAAEPAPRPRHRLPDLATAASGESSGLGGSSTGPALPFPDTEQDDGIPKPVILSWDADPADPATTAGDNPGAPDGKDSPAESDGDSASGLSRLRRGLFRRGRGRDADPAGDGPEQEPMAVQDAEFVDWVSGLSKPLADNEPETQSARRSLRTTGRHHQPDQPRP
ncbi:hypothetical protein E1182_26015 [Micromonospora sp. KC721]|nr:hypothetical protein E1182_26015 [Micromonospora sp. KC721]